MIGRPALPIVMAIGAIAVATWLGGSATGRSLGAGPHPPIDLGAHHAQATGINYASASVTLDDGSLESFFRRSHSGRVSVFSIRSLDNGATWADPIERVALAVDAWGGPMPLLDRDGELHFVIPRVRGEGRRPAIDRFIDLYHVRSTNGRTRWTEPQRIFEGYLGAIQCLAQLRGGRIIAPFADWIGGRPTSPPTGPSVTTVVYSDDGGLTWRRSPAALTSACYPAYNGANYGACEPTVVELRDGQVWMLIRTQTGFLYESFSSDGVNWSEARPSRFHSSNSPAFPIRLPDDRIVVFWNNCQMPPRVGNQGVYAGRDALHAAISSDEGREWHGFREVYRDPTRNGSPPRGGDRGTAYPHATLTRDGKIVLVSGQGENRRRRFLIDPDWLLETVVTDDCQSLDAWHVFQGFGPAARFWRDRTQGAMLGVHPDRPDSRVLQLGRATGRGPEGASWNFAAGRRGRLEARVRYEASFGGGQFSLIDRFLDPCDEQGEQFAAFSWSLDATGRLSDAHQIVTDCRLVEGVWHLLEWAWSVDDRKCDLFLDGRLVATQGLRGELPWGPSYLRLRAEEGKRAEQGGLMVESVRARIGRADVVPVRWEKFASQTPRNDDLRITARLLLNAARHNFAWAPSGAEKIENGWRDFKKVDPHDFTLPACSAAAAAAVVLKTGVFDEEVVGMTRDEAMARTLRLIRAAAVAHNGESWRYPWQSPFWAAHLAQAGWMLWDELDGETRRLLIGIVEFEANRFLEPTYRVPYWNGEGGDTKAEENAWNATIHQIACAMMPHHPNAPRWKTIGSELMISAYALEEDLENPTVMDGKPVREWLHGYNVRDDGAVVNHRRFHPDYMTCVNFNLHAHAVQSLAGQTVPEAADFRAEFIWRTLATRNWPSPPYQSPGGAIYVPGQAEVYYPEGTDWFRGRLVGFHMLDTWAYVLAWDNRMADAVAVDGPATWMRLRAAAILKNQDRHEDGRLYAADEFTNYPPREQADFKCIADAYLALWLHSHQALRPTGNWRLSDEPN